MGTIIRKADCLIHIFSLDKIMTLESWLILAKRREIYYFALKGLTCIHLPMQYNQTLRWYIICFYHNVFLWNTLGISLCVIYLKDQMQWNWYFEKDWIYLTSVHKINKYLLNVWMKNNIKIWIMVFVGFLSF